MEMEPAVLRAGRHRLLEQGHAFAGLAAEQLHGHGVARRFLEMLAAARRHNDTLCHGDLLVRTGMRVNRNPRIINEVRGIDRVGMIGLSS